MDTHDLLGGAGGSFLKRKVSWRYTITEIAPAHFRVAFMDMVHVVCSTVTVRR
jgi:hypothetical protein